MDHKVVFYNSENHLKLRKTQLYQISEKVTSFFWDPSPDRPDFEAREGQQDMACEIMDALISSKHILVEAGLVSENPTLTWFPYYFTVPGCVSLLW